MQIVGVGRNRSLLEILELAESEYTRNHSAPARLVLRSEGVELHCERNQPDTAFNSLMLRLPDEGEMAEALRGLALDGAIEVSPSNADGACEVRVRSTDAGLSVLAPLDRLSWPEVWRFEGEPFPLQSLSPERLFRAMRDKKASDVHLYPGSVQVLRVNEQMQHAEEFAPVTQRQINELVHEMAPDSAWAAFQRDLQCSFNFRQLGLAYARVSAFIKSGVPHCTIRYLAETIPSFEDLHVPRATMQRLADLHEGLVLVSGMTGSGKSTTVASLVDWINQTRSLHILTIRISRRIRPPQQAVYRVAA